MRNEEYVVKRHSARRAARLALDNNLYVSKEWQLYPTLINIYKRYLTTEYELCILYLNHTPIGVLLNKSSHAEYIHIFIDSMFRNMGLGKFLFDSYIKLYGVQDYIHYTSGVEGSLEFYSKVTANHNSKVINNIKNKFGIRYTDNNITIKVDTKGVYQLPDTLNYYLYKRFDTSKRVSRPLSPDVSYGKEIKALKEALKWALYSINKIVEMTFANIKQKLFTKTPNNKGERRHETETDTEQYPDEW